MAMTDAESSAGGELAPCETKNASSTSWASAWPVDHHAGPLHGYRRRREILGWLGRGSDVKAVTLPQFATRAGGSHGTARSRLNLVAICYPARGCVPQSGAVSGGVGGLVTWTTFEPSAFAVKIPSVSSMDMPKMISVPSGDQPGSNAK